jgi:signal transduction histidine kinase/response regulator RpfG family c-di-GMP phosphodiesterase
MDDLTTNKGLFLDIITLLSKTLDLDEGVKLDHGQRVGLLAQALATSLNSVHPDLLYITGLLHDIGGMGLKDHVLHHALHSFQDMEARNHSSHGGTILASFRPFAGIAEWVRDHHERYDGSGFPAAKSKQEISVEAGILHLADLLDVFLRTHPHLTQDKVLQFIDLQSGRAVSPAVATAGRRLFADDPANMALLTGPLDKQIRLKNFSWDLPNFQELNAPELICQLLWLIAHVADKKHQERQDHSIKVAFYSHHIAKALNDPDLNPMEVLWAALLHNIGLTAVPREDLQLDFDIRPEISPIYRQHPQLAAELIAGIRGLSHLAPIVAAHHEYYDGTGFPLGLKREKIPQAAQIIALANTYHWLTGGAVHNKEQHHQALRFIEKGKGTLFDPILAQAAINTLAVFGQRDISWLHDLPNAYAFFNTQRFDHAFADPDQRETLQELDPTPDNPLFPRQWLAARLSADLQVIAGGDDLASLAEIKDCRHLAQALTDNSLTQLQQELRALGLEKPLTMTLHSRNNKALELIFTGKEYGYDLLARGANTAPIFQHTSSVFYRNFINNPEAELLLDQHARIKEINTACLACFQIPKPLLLQTSIIQLFNPFLTPEKLLELQRFFPAQDEKTWSNEFTFITGHGNDIAIQASLYRIGGQEYDNATCLCRIINISDRKHFEQELVRRDNELRAIIHNTTGMTGKSFFESLLYQLMTLTRSKIGMISELSTDKSMATPLVFWEDRRFWSPPDAFPVKSSPCQLVVERGETYFARRLHEFFPTRFLLQDRNISSYWGMPLRRHDGVLLGIFSVYDDKPIPHSRELQTIAKIFQARLSSELARLQTEKAILEKDHQLEAQNLALTRMNQLKSDMIAITSHDLKAPLAAIIGYASLIDEHFADLETEKIKRYIHKIQGEGQKQLAFINNLLDLYRIESGAIELNLEPHRIDSLLANCLSSLRELARKRAIVFKLTVTGKATPLPVDHLRIGQVLNNLISNAIKFSPEQSAISAQYEQDEQQAFIHICDQGPGIDEQEINHIFDRYYMGRTDFEVRPEGSGLGLYIVQNIVKLHGGTVTARNNSSGGSCFTVSLPIINDSNHAQECALL